ncbi:MAG: hypothetical protein LAQ30_21600 [Acidobacteriia bacterium]|nr:hypothetical protein [Terriglobia bacterium]
MLSAYGLNQFIFHLFHYEMDRTVNSQDYPNSWFYQNPYWKYFKKFGDYVSRLSYMGSQGRHVADVAVLYPVEEVWSHGFERLPNEPVVGIVDRLMREQIDCDLVDTDSLLKAAADGERAKIGTESYRVLILPGARTVSAAAYRRVAELADRGLHVVAFGEAPRNSAERGAEDPEVIAISNRLFPMIVKEETALVNALRFALDARPDVLVLGGSPKPSLRYLHRQVDRRDVYMLVNSEERPAQWDVQFAAAGAVERWDPANGDVEPLPVAKQNATYTTLALRFEPWEAYYVVFDPAQKPAVAKNEPRAALPPIDVQGPWTIQFAPSELESVWKPDPGETVVKPPVMDVRIERADGSGEFWRRVKLQDPWNPVKGAARYLSAWDAAWITRFGYEERYGNVGGEDLTFTTQIEVPFQPAGAWLAITADARFEMRVNGEQAAAGDDVSKPVTLEKLPLKQGRNTIEVRVRGAAAGMSASANGGAGATNLAAEVRGSGYLLAQGEIRGPGGARIPPATVWYGATVPAGARAVDAPMVAGQYEAFLNDRPLAASGGSFVLPAPLPEGAKFRLKVQVTRADGGLQQPIAFHTRPGPSRLRDWQEMGMDWYSGRAVYHAAFDLPPQYAGRPLQLDLGDLRFTGEVWVNGKLADTVLWPPYRAKIAPFVRPGKNELVVIVANLHANQARWDIFDEAVSATFSRWWSDGNLLREPDHLRSGLLGPVRIVAGE